MTSVEVEVPVSRCVICGREELADSFLLLRLGEPTAAGRHFPTHGKVTYTPSEADGVGYWDLCGDHLRIIVDEINAVVRRERAKL